MADFDPGPEMPAAVADDDIPFIVDVESTWPGHLIVDGKEYQANVRKIPMTSYNYTDLTLPASHWEGTPYINSEFYPERIPTPLVCGGTSLTPFYWPVVIGGVKHQLIIGPTGAGKSSIPSPHRNGRAPSKV